MIIKKSALDEAKLFKQEVIDIPNLYLKGLYLTQAFESLLFHLLGYLVSSAKIVILKQTNGVINYSPIVLDPDKVTIHKIYERLLVFLGDKKYDNLMKSIDLAIQKRNLYIHTAFKVDSQSLLSLKNNRYYLDAGSQKKLKEWIEAFNKVSLELEKVNFELIKLKSL